MQSVSFFFGRKKYTPCNEEVTNVYFFIIFRPSKGTRNG